MIVKTIHQLKIMHRDIKFRNIMFSPSYNRNVLIDFGGCVFIKECLGYQTLTKFYGTIRYCS
jgi:serine/threonine protein kinase